MAQVLVRNLDDHIVETFRVRAERHGQSLEQELRDTLAAAAAPTEDELVELSLRVSSMTPADRQQRSDSTDLLREDRDR